MTCSYFVYLKLKSSAKTATKLRNSHITRPSVLESVQRKAFLEPFWCSGVTVSLQTDPAGSMQSLAMIPQEHNIHCNVLPSQTVAICHGFISTAHIQAS